MNEQRSNNPNEDAAVGFPFRTSSINDSFIGRSHRTSRWNSGESQNASTNTRNSSRRILQQQQQQQNRSSNAFEKMSVAIGKKQEDQMKRSENQFEEWSMFDSEAGLMKDDTTMKFALLDEGAIAQNRGKQVEKKSSFDCWEQEEPGISDVRSFAIKLNKFNAQQKGSYNNQTPFRSGIKSSLNRNPMEFSLGGSASGGIANSASPFARVRQKNSLLILQRSSSTLSQQGFNNSLLGQSPNRFDRESRNNVSHASLSGFEDRDRFRMASAGAVGGEVEIILPRPTAVKTISKVVVSRQDLRTHSILDFTAEAEASKRQQWLTSGGGRQQSIQFPKLLPNVRKKEDVNQFPESGISSEYQLQHQQLRSNNDRSSSSRILGFTGDFEKSKSAIPENKLLSIKGTQLQQSQNKLTFDSKDSLPLITSKRNLKYDMQQAVTPSFAAAAASTLTKELTPVLFSIPVKEISTMFQFRSAYRVHTSERKEDGSIDSSIDKKRSSICCDILKGEGGCTNSSQVSQSFINLNEQIPMNMTNVKENNAIPIKLTSKSLSPPKASRNLRGMIQIQKQIILSSQHQTATIDLGGGSAAKEFLSIKNLAPLKRVQHVGGSKFQLARGETSAAGSEAIFSQRSLLGEQARKDHSLFHDNNINDDGNDLEQIKIAAKKGQEESVFLFTQKKDIEGTLGNKTKSSKPVGFYGLKGSKLVSIHQNRPAKNSGNGVSNSQKQPIEFQETIQGFNNVKSPPNRGNIASKNIAVQNSTPTPYQQWMHSQLELQQAHDPIAEKIVDKKVSVYFVRKVKTPFTPRNLEKMRQELQNNQFAKTVPSTLIKQSLENDSNDYITSRKGFLRQNVSPNQFWFKR